MTTEEKYKYATGILAVIVVVLGVFLIARPEPTVTNALERAGQDLRDCRVALDNWKAEHGTTTAPLSDEARDALSSAFQMCQDKVGVEENALVP